MQMMGYQTSFMQMTCINLLASPDFTEKRIAYSALSLVIDSTSQVISHFNNKKGFTQCREISMEVYNLIETAEDSNVKKKRVAPLWLLLKIAQKQSILIRIKSLFY